MTETENPGFAERDDEPQTDQTGGGVEPSEGATSDQNVDDEGGAPESDDQADAPESGEDSSA
jgi:hypothetical protein